MKEKQIREMLSELLNEIDYDYWKYYFVEGYAEEPEMAEDGYNRMVSIVRKHLK